MLGRTVAPALAAFLLATGAALASDPIRPDPQLTPGAVLTTDTARICRPGYAKSVRHVSPKTRRRAYAEYGIRRHSRGAYEIDHLISLELGGPNSIRNLWPQSFHTQPWNARVKDPLENFLHAEVCAGRIPIELAQREIAEDWIAAYRRYLGEPYGTAGRGTLARHPNFAGGDLRVPASPQRVQPWPETAARTSPRESVLSGKYAASTAPPGRSTRRGFSSRQSDKARLHAANRP